MAGRPGDTRRCWLGTSYVVLINNAFASLAVVDLEASSRWYENLLGPGTRSMPTVMEWQFERGGRLQVYAGPERAGQGSCTLAVDDIDAIVRQLRASGVAPNAEATHHDHVDTVMIKDPDGNSIAFAMPRHSSDGSLPTGDERPRG